MGSISTTRFYAYIKYNWLQILIIILAIYDLRIDLRILFDSFTFSTLFYTLTDHPLAITVLITSPYSLKYVKK